MSEVAPKPILIFDGDCGFCRRWIRYWQSMTGTRVEYAPYQEVASRYPHIQLGRFETAVQLVEPDGATFSGAEAVFRVLATRRDLAWIYGLYRTLPPFRWISEKAYGLVARNRMFFSKFL